jgi:tetratricopeptide (TPR) repeat protein
VSRDRQEYSGALDLYRRALRVFEDAGHLEKVADQHANIAYIHAMRGERETGLAHFEKARDLYARVGHTAKELQTEKNIDLLQR